MFRLAGMQLDIIQKNFLISLVSCFQALVLILCWTLDSLTNVTVVFISKQLLSTLKNNTIFSPTRPSKQRQIQQAHLSHEFLGGEDQLMVDEPAGQLLKEGAVRVDVDRLLVLDCLVAPFAQPGSVIEISRGHCLRGDNVHKHLFDDHAE